MTKISDEPRQRVIQEYVPGKQVTLAHLISRPQKGLYLNLGIDEESSGALGILTITPSEGAIIAADIASKAAPVDIGFLVNMTQNVALEVTGRYQRIGFTGQGLDTWGGHAGIRFTF